MKSILLSNIQFLYKKSRKRQINVAINLNTFELLNFGKACKDVNNIMWLKVYFYPNDINIETVVDERMSDEIIQMITEYLGMVLRIYKYKYYSEEELSEEEFEELTEYQNEIQQSVEENFSENIEEIINEDIVEDKEATEENEELVKEIIEIIEEVPVVEEEAVVKQPVVEEEVEEPVVEEEEAVVEEEVEEPVVEEEEEVVEAVVVEPVEEEAVVEEEVEEPVVEEEEEVVEAVVVEPVEEEEVEEKVEEAVVEEEVEEPVVEEPVVEDEPIVEEEDISTNVLLHQGSSLTIKPNVSINAKITALGPVWTYDTTVEKPAGEETNGTSTHLVYTEEQQRRLNVDKYGKTVKKEIKTESVMRKRSNSI